jgi:hypothetical protein
LTTGRAQHSLGIAFDASSSCLLGAGLDAQAVVQSAGKMARADRDVERRSGEDCGQMGTGGAIGVVAGEANCRYILGLRPDANKIPLSMTSRSWSPHLVPDT